MEFRDRLQNWLFHGEFSIFRLIGSFTSAPFTSSKSQERKNHFTAEIINNSFLLILIGVDFFGIQFLFHQFRRGGCSITIPFSLTAPPCNTINWNVSLSCEMPSNVIILALIFKCFSSTSSRQTYRATQAMSERKQLVIGSTDKLLN